MGEKEDEDVEIDEEEEEAGTEEDGKFIFLSFFVGSPPLGREVVWLWLQWRVQGESGDTGAKGGAHALGRMSSCLAD